MVLDIIGFGTLGVKAGSLAAYVQSTVYGGNVVAGSLFSSLQSSAMTGGILTYGTPFIIGNVVFYGLCYKYIDLGKSKDFITEKTPIIYGISKDFITEKTPIIYGMTKDLILGSTSVIYGKTKDLILGSTPVIYEKTKDYLKKITGIFGSIYFKKNE